MWFQKLSGKPIRANYEPNLSLAYFISYIMLGSGREFNHFAASDLVTLWLSLCFKCLNLHMFLHIRLLLSKMIPEMTDDMGGWRQGLRDAYGIFELCFGLDWRVSGWAASYTDDIWGAIRL